MASPTPASQPSGRCREPKWTRRCLQIQPHLGDRRIRCVRRPATGSLLVNTDTLGVEYRNEEGSASTSDQDHLRSSNRGREEPQCFARCTLPARWKHQVSCSCIQCFLKSLTQVRVAGKIVEVVVGEGAQLRGLRDRAYFEFHLLPISSAEEMEGMARSQDQPFRRRWRDVLPLHPMAVYRGH